MTTPAHRLPAAQPRTEPKLRFIPSKPHDGGQHFHDRNGTTWPARRHHISGPDGRLAEALASWPSLHNGEMPRVTFYATPPERLDLAGPAIVIRWGSDGVRIEMTEGGSVWLLDDVDAAAVVTAGEGELRQLGLHIAERLQA
jgi:hypothetical protein